MRPRHRRFGKRIYTEEHDINMVHTELFKELLHFYGLDDAWSWRWRSMSI